jgi:hypothetical protein
VKGIGNTFHLVEGLVSPNPSNSILLILKISVSTNEIIQYQLGKMSPWPRPERFPRCGHWRLWGHGFISAYFKGYAECFWLKWYHYPLCRLILRLRPAGYFSRFQSSIETIRQSIVYRFYHHLCPPGSNRQRQGHWQRSLLKKGKYYLGMDGLGGVGGMFDKLMGMGVNLVSRSF